MSGCTCNLHIIICIAGGGGISSNSPAGDGVAGEGVAGDRVCNGWWIIAGNLMVGLSVMVSAADASGTSCLCWQLSVRVP